MKNKNKNSIINNKKWVVKINFINSNKTEIIDS